MSESSNHKMNTREKHMKETSEGKGWTEKGWRQKWVERHEEEDANHDSGDVERGRRSLLKRHQKDENRIKGAEELHLRPMIMSFYTKSSYSRIYRTIFLHPPHHHHPQHVHVGSELEDQSRRRKEAGLIQNKNAVKGFTDCDEEKKMRIQRQKNGSKHPAGGFCLSNSEGHSHHPVVILLWSH